MQNTLTKRRCNRRSGVGHLTARRIALTLDDELWNSVTVKAQKLGMPVATFVRVELKRRLVGEEAAE